MLISRDSAVAASLHFAFRFRRARRLMSIKAILHSILFSVLCVLSLSAETVADKNSAGNGSVTGTVKDKAGAALQGAQITLQPGAITVSSGAQGNYLIPNITP